VYSQNEEDGVLEELFERAGIRRGVCVDVGAHDGVYLSNTANLIKHHGWSGVLIEADPEKHAALAANMRDCEGTTCLQRLVSWSGPDGLDAILSALGVPPRFELLSIDVDSVDYYIWEGLRDHVPAVVVIEYNPSIPNHVRYVQPRNGSISHGNSLRSLIELGAQKGYRPVHVTPTNVILVEHELAARLDLPERSIDELRDDRPLMTCVFQGFDGTLLLDGPQELFWHRLPYDSTRIQILPKLLRRNPGSLSRAQRIVRGIWMAGYLGLHRQYWGVLRDKVKRRTTNTPPPARNF
jgi:hypothetical protein